MKRALCMILFAAAFVGSAFAYTWTGGGADNRWTNPSNWGGGGYPQSTTDTAEFTTDATVSLDSGNTLTVGIVKVAANKTVTVNGTAGSALNPYRAAAVDGNGFLVAEGGKLVLNVPVISSGRIDKWLPGEVVFNADVTVTGNVYFLIDCGTVTVQGTAVFSLPDGQLGLGNSKNRQLMQLNIRDSARVVARTLETIVASNPNTGTGRVVQDGENTAVFVSGNTILAGASGRDDKGVYELKAGTFTSGGTVYFGKTGLGSTQSPYGGGRFVQSGGRAVISNNFSVAALNTAARHDGSAIELSGGTFVYAPPLNTQFVLGAPLNLSGRPTVEVAGSRLTLPAETTFASDTVLVKTGGSRSLGFLLVNRDLAVDGSLVVSNGAFLVDDSYNNNNVELHAPLGNESPWPVTLASGTRFQVSLINKRVTRPLALTVESGADVRFVFADGENPLLARSILVAHSLVVDGVAKEKGRYTRANLPAVLSSDSQTGSIVVPYVWTGAGDGTSWADPANWDGSAVPPSGSGTCVDLSRAAGRTLVLDDTRTLSCLIFNPHGAAKKLTISGSGKIMHDCPSYTAGMFIGPGRELVFDVDVDKPSFSGYNTPSIVGGGRITVKKNFPGITSTDSYKRGAYVLDGELVFAGTTTFPTDANKLFGIGTWEPAGRSRIVFADGCNVTSWRLDPSPIGNVVASDEWVQDGGSVSLRNFYFTCYYSKRRTPFSYTLNGGNLSISDEFCLGSAYYITETRYPGGDFVMNGGTLTVGEFRCQRNDNHIRINGGDVFLKGGFKDTFTAGQLATNDWAVSLGGATIHSTGAWTSSLATELSGRNGATTFDTAGVNATFSSAVRGVGGIVKDGAGTLTFAGAATFTGPVVVNRGVVVFSSTVNGPSDFTVTGGVYGASLSFQTMPSATLDSIVAASANDIVVSAAANGLSVKRLVIGGVLQAPGAVAVNGGTVNVTGGGQSAWIGPNAGNWSAAANWTDGVPNGAAAEVDFGFSSLAAAASINVDVAVTLTNLTYRQAVADASLTLAGSGGLTFAADGVITVPAGNTLVIDTDVMLLGAVTKKGLGTLVVNGTVSSPGAGDTYHLIALEGNVVVNGTVSNCRLRAESDAIVPTITIGENAVVSNAVSVNPAWGGPKDRRGAVVQNGGVVDLNLPTTGFTAEGRWAMTLGTGSYTLNGGTLSVYKPNAQFVYVDISTAEFIQNGGTLKVGTMNMVPSFAAQSYSTYTLNGGTNEIETAWILGAPGRAEVFLNGGTVLSHGNSAMFAANIPVTLGGEVTFAQTAANVSVTFGSDVTGAGLIRQAGPGTLAFAKNLGDEVSLDIASNAKVSVDCEEVVVRSVSVNGIARRAGRYNAAGNDLGGHLIGTGDLVVLEGNDLGTIIVFR